MVNVSDVASTVAEYLHAVNDLDVIVSWRLLSVDDQNEITRHLEVSRDLSSVVDDWRASRVDTLGIDVSDWKPAQLLWARALLEQKDLLGDMTHYEIGEPMELDQKRVEIATYLFFEAARGPISLPFELALEEDVWRIALSYKVPENAE